MPAAIVFSIDQTESNVPAALATLPRHAQNAAAKATVTNACIDYYSSFVAKMNTTVAVTAAALLAPGIYYSLSSATIKNQLKNSITCKRAIWKQQGL